jgi:hypothetical protein
MVFYLTKIGNSGKLVFSKIKKDAGLEKMQIDHGTGSWRVINVACYEPDVRLFKCLV